MTLAEVDSHVDVVAADLSEENFGYQVSHHLKVKAYCVIDPGLDDSTISGFEKDIRSVDNEDRFYEPCKMFLDGLLGNSGSSRIAECDLLEAADRKSHGDNLEKLDWKLSEYESSIFSYFPVEVQTRTGSVLHETGEKYGLDDINDFEVARWLTIFVHHKIMVIWFLGPEEGTLELTPFDDESMATKISAKPGTVVFLRPDLLAHRYESRKTSYCLTCFYQSDAHKSKYKMDEIDVMTPTAAALDEYAFTRVEQVRERYEDDDPQRPRLPRHWELVGSHQGYIPQRLCVRTASAKYPSSHDHAAWGKALVSGVDYVEEVPLLRWDHEPYYDTSDYEHAEWWNLRKTNVKHGGFMDGVQDFDNKFFRLSPAEAGGMDPGQCLILECGYEAMREDGYTQKSLMNSRGGVFVGSGPPEWSYVPREGGGVCGCGNSISCGRVSFTFGMKGPCISVELGNASSLAVLSECCTLLSIGRGKWEPPPFGLVSCYHLQLAYQSWLMHSATGLCSKGGRCFAFEASADGFIRGDNVSALVIKNTMTQVDGEPILRDDYDSCLGYLAGNSLCQSGRRATITTPDAMAMQEVAILAQRSAQISPLDVDAVECHANGNILEDAMESSAVTRAYRPDGMIGIEQTATLAMSSSKPNLADAMEGAGLQQILKVMWGLRYGYVCPTGHLRLLNPHIDIPVCERPVNLSGELLEYPMDSAYCGIQSLSFAGLSAHCICFGEVKLEDDFKLQARPKDALLYWPAGGGGLAADKVPQKSYWIAGSWSQFEAQEMEKESKDVYSFTVTLGENRWEHFQIWLDGKKTKALYPGELKGSKGSKVNGPEDILLFNTWVIDGRPMPMYREDEVEDPNEGALVEPTYYDLQTEDTGEVGDQYRVRLKIAGKYRTVEWEKTNEQKPEEVPKGKYYVLGSWSDLSAEEMTVDSEEEGRYSVEVTLSENGGDFLITRNQDWMQVIYPYEGGSYAQGPDAMQMSSTWHIGGRPLDKYLIEFSRFDMKVTWKKTGVVSELPALYKEKLTMPEYHLAGSWDSFNTAHRMIWSGKAGAFQAYAELGEKARLDFIVLRDGKASAAYYPSVNHAGLNEGDVVGPGMKIDHDLCWRIGKEDGFGGQKDQAAKGKRYLISVTPTKDRTKIHKVEWSATDSSRAPLEDALARSMFVYGL